MSANLITLQDSDVRVYAPRDVLARSPGFANIAGKEPLFGEPARQQARLHPRQSFNQFWSQLSLDPLTIRNKHFRHAADLAHGHLVSLTEDLALDSDTVIAVPSSYNRNQLSVLLGIAKTCRIPVNGLVDLSLLQAMAADSSGADSSIVVDLQLHQAVLTSFHRVNGLMQRDRVVQVPAGGLLALQDAWTNMIADEFIRQTRFDPKHNAEVEQHLYNMLDHWIAESRAGNELMIDINHKGTVHQARITHEAFGLRAKHVFERIRKELEQLRGPDTVVQVLRSHLALPGLTAGLPGVDGVDDEGLLEACMANLGQILKSPEQLQFVTRLPLAQTGETSVRRSAPPRLPTHVLLENRAIALPLGRLALGRPTDAGGYARVVALAGLESGALVLNRIGGRMLLELEGLDAVTLNGEPARAGAELKLGDTLQTGGAAPLRLIQVE